MSAYRIYTVGRDRHFTGVKIAECSDDQEAVQKAKQAGNGHDVELWDHGRFIMRFPRDDSQK